TDDMRDAPSLDILPALQARGAQVQAFDPEGRHEAEKLLPGVTFKSGPYEAAEGADVLLILTEWDQFRALDLPRLKTLLKAPVVVDLRNVYKTAEMVRAGFTYASIGRGA
ncbi:MAG: UDP-glucose 6-dehydrogenase, partial [Caulobacter sp.]|nr:UDP-glucose 6-dehydrogenase [Caulobacter sp.]